MKAALVYTSTTPELIELVEREVNAQIGEDVDIISLENPDILAQIRAAGYVRGYTPKTRMNSSGAAC